MHIATSKEYSARTRTFIATLGSVDEQLIVSALRNPNKAIEETQKQAQEAKESHAKMGKTLRMVGVGLGAVAGGVVNTPRCVSLDILTLSLPIVSLSELPEASRLPWSGLASALFLAYSVLVVLQSA